MPYIKTNSNTDGKSIDIFYQDWGSGQPVVLIHGWPLNHEMWEYQVPALVESGFRCIAYDRRGFGKSDKPWQGYDYDSLADDLKSLMDELELEDVTLVGFSMGGGEVVRYLSRHGAARVSKVVLISSVVPLVLKTEDNPEGVDKQVFDNIIENLEDDRPAFLSTFAKSFYGVNIVKRPVSTDLLQWQQVLALMGSPKATIECVHSFSETDFRKELRSINVPTLIIHGDNDKTVPIGPTSNMAAKEIPQAQYLVYEGAPHGLFFTEKEKLNNDLLNFISDGTTISKEEVVENNTYTESIT